MDPGDFLARALTLRLLTNIPIPTENRSRRVHQRSRKRRQQLFCSCVCTAVPGEYQYGRVRVEVSGTDLYLARVRKLNGRVNNRLDRGVPTFTFGFL